MKIRFLLFQSIAFIVLIVITSCSSMYIPSTVNIPLLESKGEKQVELTSSTNSIHLTGNYAFSEKYSVMVNGGLSYRNFTDSYDIFTSINTYRDQSIYNMRSYGEFAHKYIEGGIGRYNIIPGKFIKLELFGGAGYGNAIDKDGRYDYDADYYLGFMQINAGATTQWLDIGGAFRFATTFYDYTYTTGYKIVEPRNIKFSMLHFEPMAFIRSGGKNLKFVARCGLSLPFLLQPIGWLDLERGIHRGQVSSSVIHLSLGVNYKFGIKEKKENDHN